MAVTLFSDFRDWLCSIGPTRCILSTVCLWSGCHECLSSHMTASTLVCFYVYMRSRCDRYIRRCASRMIIHKFAAYSCRSCSAGVHLTPATSLAARDVDSDPDAANRLGLATAHAGASGCCRLRCISSRSMNSCIIVRRMHMCTQANVAQNVTDICPCGFGPCRNSIRSRLAYHHSSPRATVAAPSEVWHCFRRSPSTRPVLHPDARSL